MKNTSVRDAVRFQLGDEVFEVVGVGEDAKVPGPKAKKTKAMIVYVDDRICMTMAAGHHYDRLTGDCLSETDVYRAIHSIPSQKGQN